MTIDPADLSLVAPTEGDLDGGDAAANAEICHRLFKGEIGPKRDIVVLNAAAGLVVAGLADDIAAGMALASESIDSGAAAGKLASLVEASA